MFPFAAAIGLLGSGAGLRVWRRRLARVLERIGGRRRIAWTLGLVVLAAMIDAAGTRILPRLYPAFHLAVTAIAIAIAGFASLGLRGLDRARQSLFGVAALTPAALRAAAALALFAIGAAFASPAAKRLARFDNVRLVYTERAPAIAQAIAFAARIAPPPAAPDAPLEAKTSGHAIDFSGRDIVLISVDALRADHVGAYGYARPDDAPHIDALAKDGVVFDAAYSPTPHTSYAVTSMMTGKYMRPLVLQGLGADSETLAAHLRRYGYKTAGFFPPAIFYIDEERFTRFRDSGPRFRVPPRRVLAGRRAGRRRSAAYLDGIGPEAADKPSSSSGSTSSSRTSPTRRTRTIRSASATSIATTARSRPRTTRSAPSSTWCALAGRARSSS